MKLLSACCGSFLMGMPGALVDAQKKFYDYRTGVDFESEDLNCGEILGALRHAAYVCRRVFLFA